MKKLAIIYLFVATIVITAVSEAQDIPSSARSRASISRIKPKLQKEFSRAGLNWGTPIFVRIFKKTKELEIWMNINTQSGSNFGRTLKKGMISLRKTDIIHQMSK
jgi:murein L,D-transpeptidase YafK